MAVKVMGFWGLGCSLGFGVLGFRGLGAVWGLASAYYLRGVKFNVVG